MGEWNGKQPWGRSRAIASVGSCQWWAAVLRKLSELEDDVDSSGSVKRELRIESEMRVGWGCRAQSVFRWHCSIALWI